MAYGTVNADVIGTSIAGSNLGAGNASIMKNRIINGAMVIDQRNAGASISVGSSPVYPVDRFQVRIAQGSGHTGQQVTTAPTGFNNSLKVTVGTGAAPTAAQNTFINQQIEGYNFANLGWGTASAKTITVSFKVYSSLTGTFAYSISNSALDRSYVATYSIPVANTWTDISLTIAGDTSGTWLTTDGIGSFNIWDLGSGLNKNTTTGSWQAGWYTNTSSTVNVAGTSGATFYITGVQLEVGSSATGFEYVNYQTSLANCQRYYWQMVSGNDNTMANGVYYNTTTFICTVQYPVTMRTSPTLSYVTGTGYYSIFVNGTDAIDGFYLGATTATGTNIESGGQGASGTTGYGGQLRSASTSARVGFTAEL